MHAANSAAILGAPPAWLDAVRPGLALYGVSPADALASDALRPAMTIEARIASVRTVPAGTPLGYGGRFVTSRESTIAVLPIGYRDGLRRCMSGRVSVLVRGMRVPVVGAVSMDVTLVDATGTGVRRGDRAVCLGARRRRDGDGLGPRARRRDDPLRDPVRNRSARRAGAHGGPRVIVRALESVGRKVIRFLEELGRFFGMLGRILAWAPRPPYDVGEWVRQMVRVGVDSIPLVLLTTLFTGMVLALQTYTGFARFNAQSLVGAVVALSLTRELAPVLSALMVSGRVGSAMAAEIGSMRVTEQIDALEALATEPVQYLVVPRVFASVLMLPLLVVLGDVVGMYGGFLVAVQLLGANPVTYYDSSFQFLDLEDFTVGLVKAAVFGLILSVVACSRGYHTEGGAEGVGRSTTQAVVVGSLAILLADFFLTRLLF